MDGLRSVWRRGGEQSRLPKRNEHMTVADSLLAEVDFHIVEQERLLQQQRREEMKTQTGVDYSWLVSETPKQYRIPQLERLELEELCMKLEASECARVVSLFRDAALREPRVENLARIMRCCVIQVLDQRAKEHASSSVISGRVAARAYSLVSLRFKSATRVGPVAEDCDIEMQAEGQNRTTRAFSMPNFTVTSTDVPVVQVGENTGSHPV